MFSSNHTKSPALLESLSVNVPCQPPEGSREKGPKAEQTELCTWVQLGPLPEESWVAEFMVSPSRTTPQRKIKTYSKILTASVSPFHFIVRASASH